MRRTILDHTPDGLKQRLSDLERQVADQSRHRTTIRADAPLPPLLFHWSGPVADYLDYRAGPGALAGMGTIYRIEYRFDVAASVTVAWEIDGVALPGSPHTVSSRTQETMSAAYDSGDIVGTVTADAGAEGLTALVFLR